MAVHIQPRSHTNARRPGSETPAQWEPAAGSRRVERAELIAYLQGFGSPVRSHVRWNDSWLLLEHAQNRARDLPEGATIYLHGNVIIAEH